MFIALLLFLAASLRYPNFLSLGVVVNLIDDNAFLGIAAVGMTFVILTGGIDLSVGSMIGFVSILSAILVERLHLHPALVFLIVIAIGSVFGALMGFLIAYFDIAPFLVTLAGMFFIRGLALTLSQESIPLKHPLFKWFLSLSISIGQTALPPTGLIFLLVVALGIYVATLTRFGRTIYAIGGNMLSAHLMGLKVKATLVRVYLLSGFLSAVAGFIYSVYTSSGNSTAAMGAELDVISAVVIGGTLLTGGRGNVFGTLVGVFILGLIQTIITFEGTLSSWWTRIAIGILLFLFVGLQQILTNLPQIKTHFKITFSRSRT